MRLHTSALAARWNLGVLLVKVCMLERIANLHGDVNDFLSRYATTSVGSKLPQGSPLNDLHEVEQRSDVLIYARVEYVSDARVL